MHFRTQQPRFTLKTIQHLLPYEKNFFLLACVIKTINEHNHDASARDVEAIRVNNAIKRRAESTTERPSQIINESVRQTSAAVLPLLKRKNLNRVIQRRRIRVEAAPSNPISLSQLQIPQRYTVYYPSPGQGMLAIEQTLLPIMMKNYRYYSCCII